MAYEVTATRKRPQDFDKLVGQEFVVSTLENAIKENRIAHAYLFAGPRGVGKTSSARLLAKALNCQKGMSAHPCGVCSSCREITEGTSIDCIEIDGASNTSVNDIRAIKEEVLFPPQSSRFKIYIIDEVHMLSNSAFNALLKTIEEPPEYIIFIFATTELQKVPATIKSRCQVFKFQLIPQEKIEALLKEAAEELKIKADDDALFWISKEATGSMRDAYTLFDQVASFSGDHITLKKIEERLNLAGFSKISQIVSSLLFSSCNKGLEILSSLIISGVSPEQITKDSADFFRSLLLYKNGITRTSLLGCEVKDIPQEVVTLLSKEQLEVALRTFLNLYRDLRYTLSPETELELVFSRLSSLPYLVSNETLMKNLEEMKKGVIEGSVVVKKKQPKEILLNSNSEEKEESKEEKQKPSQEEVTIEKEEEKPSFSIDGALIDRIIENLPEKKKTLLSPHLRKASISKDCSWVILNVQNLLSQELINENSKELGRIIEELTGSKYSIKVLYTAPQTKEKASLKMEKLKEIFGGKINYNKEEKKEQTSIKEMVKNDGQQRDVENNEEFDQSELNDGESVEEDD